MDNILLEARAWRRQLHSYPETGFEECRTADFVATQLEAFGLEVHRGIGGTGGVGALRGGEGGRSIAFRADMDALDIIEAPGVDHCSRTRGKMHACGHD